MKSKIIDIDKLYKFVMDISEIFDKERLTLLDRKLVIQELSRSINALEGDMNERALFNAKKLLGGVN